VAARGSGSVRESPWGRSKELPNRSVAETVGDASSPPSRFVSSIPATKASTTAPITPAIIRGRLRPGGEWTMCDIWLPP
jgi:hypothetical protein